MKSIRFSPGWISCFLIACMGFLLIAFTPRSMAEPADSSASALATAQMWLTQIDAGKYDDIYPTGCVAFHEKVSLEKWVSVLKTIRMPLGPVVSRKEISHTDKPDGFEGLEGECMLIKYDTSFQKMPDMLEIVLVKREDGKWKGAGYNCAPKQALQPAPVPTVQ